MNTTMLDYIQSLGLEDQAQAVDRQEALWLSLTRNQPVISAVKVVKVWPSGAMTSWHPSAHSVVYRVGDIYAEEARPYNRGGLYVFAGSAADNVAMIDHVVSREFTGDTCAVLDCLAAGPYQFYDPSGNWLGNERSGPTQYRDGVPVVDYRSIKIACSALWVKGVCRTIVPTPRPVRDSYNGMTAEDYFYK